MSNYRPVSGLAYVGKLIEKIVATSFNNHITRHDLDEKYQSAYRPYHSVETALVKVFNDVLISLENGKGVMLVLLDLSAAFDTVDPNILVERLENLFGITGSASEWTRSYFENRTQSVKVQNSLSKKKPVNSLPQGSNFGPFGFPKYSSPIGKICAKHGISYHMYADDTQLYIEFTHDNIDAKKAQLEACIAEIKAWMANNRLKLNDSKTEFVIFGSKHFMKSLSDTMSIKIG